MISSSINRIFTILETEIINNNININIIGIVMILGVCRIKKVFIECFCFLYLNYIINFFLIEYVILFKKYNGVGHS